jgi:hypothetical protein
LNGEVTSALVPTEDKKSRIRDIEPLLKWAAVAYGGGFLTVMLHTYRLGIPVVELIEPIYIWVGTPLAVAAYFIGQLIALFKRTLEKLPQELNEAKRDRDKLFASKIPEDAARALSALIGISLRVFGSAVPLVPLEDVLRETLAPLLKRLVEKKLESGDDRDTLSYIIKLASVIYFLTAIAAAFNRFFLRLVMLALVPATLCLYVLFAYPAIPQSLGGGKPSQVRLIVDTKKIPTDDTDLRNLFPQSPIENEPANSRKAELSGPESHTTCILALHYQNEHTYYVERTPGPIVAIDHDAVEGVIYGPVKGSPQSCM